MSEIRSQPNVSTTSGQSPSASQQCQQYVSQYYEQSESQRCEQSTSRQFTQSASQQCKQAASQKYQQSVHGAVIPLYL